MKRNQKSLLSIHGTGWKGLGVEYEEILLTQQYIKNAASEDKSPIAA